MKQHTRPMLMQAVSRWSTRIAATALLSAALTGTEAAAQTGLLVVAHGAGQPWNARVRETVRLVNWPHGPVALAFLMGEEATSAGWERGVDALIAGGAKAVVVVPLMVSSHGGHFRDIEYYAGVRDSLGTHQHGAGRRPPPVPMRVAAALDGAPELGGVLADRWAALAATDRGRPVVLVAHGPSSDPEAARWIENLSGAATALRAAGLERQVRVGLLRDDAPATVRAAAIAALRDTVRALAGPGDSVLVVPILISSGTIDQVKIPQDLAELPVRYAPAPLAPHPLLARWIERSAARLLPPGDTSGQ